MHIRMTEYIGRLFKVQKILMYSIPDRLISPVKAYGVSEPNG